jgi:hypothetical protein
VGDAPTQDDGARAQIRTRLLAVAVMIGLLAPVPGGAAGDGAIVGSESLRVYTHTSTRSEVVTTLRRGTAVIIDMTIGGRADGEWCLVTQERAPAPLGFVRCASLDRVSIPRGGQTAPPPARASIAAPVIVPIHVVGNLAVVSVALEQRETAFLLLDSGASATIITPVMLRLLGLAVPPNAPRRQLAVIGGRSIEVPFVRLSSLSVGSATVRDIEVGVYDVAPQAPVVDGLLGADVLQRFSATIDPAARRLRLVPPTPPRG